MYDFTPAGRRFFDAPRPADHRLHGPALGSVLPFRDRVATGYYDQPDLTEAVVARMLRLLETETGD